MVYELDQLMLQTRRLAAEFYRTTQTTLPVSSELARYDAVRLLNLKIPENKEHGVDAIEQSSGQEKKIQIKGRVIFDSERHDQRLGQIALTGLWDDVLLVLFNADYEAIEIHAVTREKLLMVLPAKESSGRVSRGAMSVAKFKKLATLVWSREKE